MTFKEICGLLSDYCSWDGDYTEKARQLLAKNPDIDLMSYHNGLLFGLAISKKSASMLKVLLNHFEQNQLGPDPYSQKALTLKHKLRLMLDEEEEVEDAPLEIQELLKPYTFVEETRSEVSLEEFSEEAGLIPTKEDNYNSYSDLTAVNLMALNHHHFEDV